MTCPVCGRPGKLERMWVNKTFFCGVRHEDGFCPIGGVVELWRVWRSLWGGR